MDSGCNMNQYEDCSDAGYSRATDYFLRVSGNVSPSAPQHKRRVHFHSVIDVKTSPMSGRPLMQSRRNPCNPTSSLLRSQWARPVFQSSGYENFSARIREKFCPGKNPEAHIRFTLTSESLFVSDAGTLQGNYIMAGNQCPYTQHSGHLHIYSVPEGCDASVWFRPI